MRNRTIPNIIIVLIIALTLAFIFSIIPCKGIYADSATDIASGTWGDCEWIIDSSGTLTVSEGTIPSVYGEADIAWGQYANKIRSVRFDGTVHLSDGASSLFYECNNMVSFNASGLDTSNVTDMGALFFGCDSLVNLDLSQWDTSNVKNMNIMFEGCSSLKNLDISGWNTGKVTEMSYMFSDCKSLIIINVSNWDTSNVTNMAGLFYNCDALSSVDLSKWDTSKVNDMNSAFNDCSSLTSLNISGWNTSNVRDMSRMFNGCTTLSDIDLSRWDTGMVTDMSYMFSDCKSLIINVSNWDTSNVTNMAGLFYNCDALSSVDLSKWDTSKVNDMNSAFNDCSSLTSLNISGWNTSNVRDMSRMFNGCTTLSDIDLSRWDTGMVTNMGGMFSGCEKFEKLNVSEWDTSNVTNMADLFHGCEALTSLDISEWDTSKVKDMGCMFAGCSVLKNLEVSRWDTSSVRDMHWMFDDCASLLNLDVAGWDTSEVTDMSLLFDGCRSLTGLDVSGWDTSQVTNMWSMFEYCTSLRSLDVSKWDTGKVTVMTHLFFYCNSLANIDVSKWDTSNVTGMAGMFYSCDSLTSLDLSGWDTSNVINMNYMFRSDVFSGNITSTLQSLDLSGWDTSNVEKMSQLFYGCGSLTSLDLSGWNTSKVTDLSQLFFRCKSLKSLDLSGWDTSSVTNVYQLFYFCQSLEFLNLSGWDLSKAGDLNGLLDQSLMLKQFVFLDSNASFSLPKEMMRKSTGSIVRDITTPDVYVDYKVIHFNSNDAFGIIREQYIPWSEEQTAIPLDDLEFSYSDGARVFEGWNTSQYGNGVWFENRQPVTYEDINAVTGDNDGSLMLYAIWGDYAITDSGTCGDNLKWELRDNGVLTISGTGEMYSYSHIDEINTNVPWNSYRDKINKVIIKDGATSIGDNAFQSLSNLTEVTIPNGVTKIGGWAFSGCISLPRVIIPDSVTSIGTMAFNYCICLAEISIPASVTSIGDRAFADCGNLRKIVVEEGNPRYDSRNNCNALIETETNKLVRGCNKSTIPEGVTIIGGDAFSHCSELMGVVIPDSVTTIEDYAFHGCSNLTSFVVPDSVTSIAEGLLSECYGLKSVIIHDRVTSIGDFAFYNCRSLDSVTIPDSVNSLGTYLFNYKDPLTIVYTVPGSYVDQYPPDNCTIEYLCEEVYVDTEHLGFPTESIVITTEMRSLHEINLSDYLVSSYSLDECTVTLSNEDDFTYDNGVIRSLNNGECDVTVSKGNLKATLKVIAQNEAPAAIEKISLYENNVVLLKGEMDVNTASLSPINADTSDILWSSSDESVVTVKNGLLTAVGAGTATVTAYSSANSGIKAECRVTVEAPLYDILPIEDPMMIQQGTSRNVNYYVFPSGSTDTIFFESQDPEIAEVDKNGRVNAKAVGTTIITISSGDIRKSITVKVVKDINVPEDSMVIRISGNNRFMTAIEAADYLKKKKGISTFSSIVLADGIGFPDALSASYLAYRKDAPILLIHSSVMTMVADYINTNLAPGGTVFIVGGEGVVAPEVEQLINGNVKRLAGKDRYETNIKVLEEAGLEFNDSENVLVACGTNFADALSASAVGEPILLVGKELNAKQETFLKSFLPEEGEAGYQCYEFSIIGGTGAVPEKVEDQLKSLGSVERVYGSNRYQTSIAVAERFFEGNQDTVVIANGNNFPDGLSGGPVATAYGGPLVLAIDKVNDHAVKYFKDKDAYRLVIMGGTGVISDETAGKIAGNTL